MSTKQGILSPRILLGINITVALSFFAMMPLYYLFIGLYEISISIFTVGVVCAIVVFALKNEISRDVRLCILISTEMLGLMVPTLFGAGSPHTYSALAAGLVIAGLVLHEKVALINSITIAVFAVGFTVFNGYFIPGYDYLSLATGMAFVIISCIATYLFVAVVSTQIKVAEQKNKEIEQMLEELKAHKSSSSYQAPQTDVVESIKAVSSTLTTSAENMVAVVNGLAESSNRQAFAVEKIASSFSEIAQASEKNARNINRIKTLSNTTNENIKSGRKQMQMMSSAMEDITRATKEISNIMNVIEDIAFQTNIIANNSEIENYKAGYPDKNVAKIIQEMQSLAKLSTQTVANTQVKINNVTKSIENGKSIVDKTAQSIEKIVISIEDSTIIIDKVNQSTNEQFEAIMNMEKNLASVSELLARNTVSANKSTEAVNDVNVRIKKLHSMIAV